MVCIRCDRPVLARPQWTGREVQCPYCHSVLRVPQPPADGRPVRADGPTLSAKHYFHFACPRCESLLEAHTGMCGQAGTCPTCAARFSVPYLNASGQTVERFRSPILPPYLRKTKAIEASISWLYLKGVSTGAWRSLGARCKQTPKPAALACTVHHSP